MIVVVYNSRFAVPGTVAETGLGTVRISYHAPGASNRADWFHALDAEGKKAGRRMGDQDEDAVRYREEK